MAEPAIPPPQSAFGALPAPRPAVRLQERPDLLIRQIAVWREAEVDALRVLLAERLSLALPDGLDAAGRDGRLVLPIGPRRWWLIEEREPGVGLAGVLGRRAALTDLSHARSVLRLDGPAARNVLAKLCRVDLHPSVLPPGRVVQTALGQVPALIHALEQEPGFDLYLPRSLAVSAAASLIDAAEEFAGGPD
jgi:sarcosine oxidase subunit gamma